jgi:lysophospholipase L1-like esterase
MNIICLGDSLMQQNGQDTYPQEGWPQELHNYLKDPDNTKVLDFALNGRSTKSFLDEGQFKKALDAAKEGDICLISFGHNDEKVDPKRHTDPYTTYQENLKYMQSEMKKKGVDSIFLSSVTRLKYDTNNILLHTHGDYPKAMEMEAKKLGIPYINLEKLSYDSLSQHDFDFNSFYFMCLNPDFYPNYQQGEKDTSHLNLNGAKWICKLVVPELIKIKPLTDLFLRDV